MSRTAIAVFLLIAIGRYVAASLFAHPFGDDFSYAVAGMRADLLPRLLDEYQLWNGRWASNPLLLRGPIVLGLDHGLWLYRAVPCVLLLVGLLAARSLSNALLPGLSRMDSWLSAGLLLLLGLQGLSDPGEGIYWYTGAITYFLPASLAWFLVAYWIRVWREGWTMSLGGSVAVGFLALFISGFNELHMVFMVLLHVLLVVSSGAGSKRMVARALIPMGMVLFGAAVMILAPGNSVRGAQFPLSHEIGRTLLGGIAQSARFSATWLLSPVFLLALLMAAGHAASIRRASVWMEDARLPRPLTIGAVVLCFILVAMALPYWATGLLGQHRTVNATWLFILPLVLLLVLVQLHRQVPPAMPAGLRTFASLLLGMGLLFTGTSGTLTSDLAVGRMESFDDQLRERYGVLRNAVERRGARVLLEPLHDPPATFHFLDAGPDSGNWVNRSMAYYFGADSTQVVVQQR